MTRREETPNRPATKDETGRSILGSLLLLLAACGEKPVPLPGFEDTGLHRECECVTKGRCTSLETIEGESEARAFRCRPEPHRPRRAVCSYEGRFKPAGGQWSQWEKAEFSFRQVGEAGWCWDAPSPGHSR